MYLQRWHGWCHMKLQPSRRRFCVHHTTMHHVTSCKATYVRCLAVTCHLYFWQNDRDLLCATAITHGWNRYRNKSQHRKSTLEKKILPLLLQGLEPATHMHTRTHTHTHTICNRQKTNKQKEQAKDGSEEEEDEGKLTCSSSSMGPEAYMASIVRWRVPPWVNWRCRSLDVSSR